jgi:hypothetical protein
MRLAALAAVTAASALLGALPAAGSAAGTTSTAPLLQEVMALPVETEHREGYDRLREFGGWIDADRDGCNTRAEVMLAEAVQALEVTGRCTLNGGTWYSYYDDQRTDRVDIDHLVPLAEAWDSGAWRWTKAERVAYANNLDVDHHLIAVTPRSNRQKADKDVAEWLPIEPVRCRYVTEWVTVKRDNGLSVDTKEKQALLDLARQCPETNS